MNTAISKRGWVSAACATVLASAVWLPVPARAASVWYEVDFFGANASGTLKGKAFNNANLQFDFFGDPSTTRHYSVKNPGKTTYTTGYINLAGSATFHIYDPATFATIGSGSFESSAGIYVSVDNTNGGIGFGSFGVPPGNAHFPGPPVYPGSILVPACCVTPNVTKYDLQSNFFVSAYQLSCYGFPGSCKTGPALATSAGPLVLKQVTVAQGQFNAQVFPYAAIKPMNSLGASVTVASASSQLAGASMLNHFQVQGSFFLGADSESVDPGTQDVVLRLGPHSFEIPAGSFVGSRAWGYVFDGKVGGVALHASLTPQGADGYAFQVEGDGVPALPDPLLVRLTVGEAIGRTIAKPVRP